MMKYLIVHGTGSRHNYLEFPGMGNVLFAKHILLSTVAALDLIMFHIGLISPALITVNE
jgi:hypothetical protein